jgi:hypothetical protein
VPVSPDRISQVESLDRVRKIAHEISAAELTIRGSLKSQLFLFGENPLDRFVFYLPQQFRIPATPRFQQSSWPKKTPDVIRSEYCIHTFPQVLKLGGRRRARNLSRTTADSTVAETRIIRPGAGHTAAPSLRQPAKQAGKTSPSC